jgi:hypothetical protein
MHLWNEFAWGRIAQILAYLEVESLRRIVGLG